MYLNPNPGNPFHNNTNNQWNRNSNWMNWNQPRQNPNQFNWNNSSNRNSGNNIFGFSNANNNNRKPSWWNNNVNNRSFNSNSNLWNNNNSNQFPRNNINNNSWWNPLGQSQPNYSPSGTNSRFFFGNNNNRNNNQRKYRRINFVPTVHTEKPNARYPKGTFRYFNVTLNPKFANFRNGKGTSQEEIRWNLIYKKNNGKNPLLAPQQQRQDQWNWWNNTQSNNQRRNNNWNNLYSSSSTNTSFWPNSTNLMNNRPPTINPWMNTGSSNFFQPNTTSFNTNTFTNNQQRKDFWFSNPLSNNKSPPSTNSNFLFNNNTNSSWNRNANDMNDISTPINNWNWNWINGKKNRSKQRSIFSSTSTSPMTMNTFSSPQKNRKNLLDFRFDRQSINHQAKKLLKDAEQYSNKLINFYFNYDKNIRDGNTSDPFGMKINERERKENEKKEFWKNFYFGSGRERDGLFLRRRKIEPQKITSYSNPYGNHGEFEKLEKKLNQEIKGILHANEIKDGKRTEREQRNKKKEMEMMKKHEKKKFER